MPPVDVPIAPTTIQAVVAFVSLFATFAISILKWSQKERQNAQDRMDTREKERFEREEKVRDHHMSKEAKRDALYLEALKEIETSRAEDARRTESALNGVVTSLREVSQAVNRSGLASRIRGRKSDDE
jgi:RNase adaptor protein for sRNA GlmZ degradation